MTKLIIGLLLILAFWGITRALVLECDTDFGVELGVGCLSGPCLFVGIILFISGINHYIYFEYDHLASAKRCIEKKDFEKANYIIKEKVPHKFVPYVSKVACFWRGIRAYDKHRAENDKNIEKVMNMYEYLLKAEAAYLINDVDGIQEERLLFLFNNEPTSIHFTAKGFNIKESTANQIDHAVGNAIEQVVIKHNKSLAISLLQCFRTSEYVQSYSNWLNSLIQSGQL